MGEFTNLRLKGHIKEKYKSCFENIALKAEWNFLTHIPEVAEFMKLDSHVFIPTGTSTSFPDEWISNTGEPLDGFDHYDKVTGQWAFQCSLKDYENVIEKFFLVLPQIMKSVEYLETFYYWDYYSRKYELIDGKEIIMTNKKYINYVPDPDEIE